MQKNTEYYSDEVDLKLRTQLFIDRSRLSLKVIPFHPYCVNKKKNPKIRDKPVKMATLHSHFSLHTDIVKTATLYYYKI